MRKNLKDARKRLGMTQYEMAGQLGISPRTYQSIEQGRRGGSFGIWDKLELITGVHQTILRTQY